MSQSMVRSSLVVVARWTCLFALVGLGVGVKLMLQRAPILAEPGPRPHDLTSYSFWVPVFGGTGTLFGIAVGLVAVAASAIVRLRKTNYVVHIRFERCAEIRMGSPFQTCDLQVTGSWTPPLRASDSWQNISATSPDSRFIGLVKWDTPGNEPGFQIIAIDCRARRVLTSKRWLGCCEKLTWTGGKFVPSIARIVSLMALAALLLIGAGASPARAQLRPALGVVDGVVTDTNLVSLADATASILGTNIQVVTGANGRFRIRGVPANQYILVVRRVGYVPVSSVLQISDRDTLRLSFALERITTALDTVVVVAKQYATRMSEFEDRRKFGFGHFLTQADIEKQNAVSVGDLLRTVLSVQIEGRKMFSQVAMNMRGGCAFKIYLDGIQLSGAGELGDVPSPRNLAGIEIYSGPATIPMQYQRAGGGCGVILIWTKGAL